MTIQRNKNNVTESVAILYNQTVKHNMKKKKKKKEDKKRMILPERCIPSARVYGAYMKMMMMHSSKEVYSRTGTYFRVNALKRAKATPIPAEAKNMTQKCHTVYNRASPELIEAMAGDAISNTVLLR